MNLFRLKDGNYTNHRSSNMAAGKLEGRDADFIALDLTSETEPTF
jgi:hypothetical protein